MAMTQDPESYEDDTYNASLPNIAPAPKKFKIAWFCPLPIEQEAAVGSLDSEYDVDIDEYMRDHSMRGDLNDYRLGTIRGHNIVICRPPDKRAGPIVAAMGWRDLSRSFPDIKHLFIVGIGGGAPTTINEPDVRLGDVVIGLADKSHPGMIQIDAGHQNESFRPLININPPPKTLQALAQKLIDLPTKMQGNQTKANIFKETAEDILEQLNQRYPGKWLYPGVGNDCCFEAGSKCQDRRTCPVNCRGSNVAQKFRLHRQPGQQFIYGGLLCSSSKVIKDAEFRDRTVNEYLDSHGQILCFETEGYGIASDLPCLSIRGISDYADCHKTPQWQPYAAVHAAAAARIITILLIQTTHIAENQRTQIRKDTVIHGGPVNQIPASSPKPRVSTFPNLKDLGSSPYRSSTNPPEQTYNFLTKGANETIIVPAQTNGKARRLVYPKPLPPLSTHTEESDFSDHGRSLSSGTFSSLSPRSPRQQRIDSNQLEPISPGFHNLSRNATNEFEPIRRESTDKASLKSEAILEYIPTGQTRASISDSSSRRPSHGSYNIIPFRTKSSQAEPQPSAMTHPGPQSPLIGEHRQTRQESFQTLPSLYTGCDVPIRSEFKHDRRCLFSVDIGNWDNRQDDNHTFRRHGPFYGEFEISMYLDPQPTIPSKLLTFRLENSEEYVQFWLPVDEISVKELDGWLVVEWSDCESITYKMIDGRSQCLREHNAHYPNMKLYVSFDQEKDKNYFHERILNLNLQESSWAVQKSSGKGIEDAYGKTIRVFRRHDGVVTGAGILIATVAPPWQGQAMKVHCMKVSFVTLLEHRVEGAGASTTCHFIITELSTIEYLTKPDGRGYYDEFRRETRNGRPDKQQYVQQKVAERGQDALVIKLSMDTLPQFLEMVFPWTLIFFEHASAIHFKGRTKKDMMLLLYKHEDGRFWILCCNIDTKLNQKLLEAKREWFMFEVNSDTKKELKRKKLTIGLPIRRWKQTFTLSHDEFRHRLQDEKLALTLDFPAEIVHERVWQVFNGTKPRTNSISS